MKDITVQQIRMDMGRFKAILEAGEAPTIEGQTSAREKLRPGQLARQVRLAHRKDKVDYASDQSFPASDAPGRIGDTVGADQEGEDA
jgi:hypothetical protein